MYVEFTCRLELLTNLTKRAIKYIQGTIITISVHVMQVILHLHLDRVSIIVFPTLELLVPVLSTQPLKNTRTLINRIYMYIAKCTTAIHTPTVHVS